MVPAQEIENRLKAIVAQVLQVPPDQVLPESRFKEDLGADSLDLVLLLYELEEKMGMTLSDDDARRMLTVADAVRLVTGLANRT